MAVSCDGVSDGVGVGVGVGASVNGWRAGGDNASEEKDDKRNLLTQLQGPGMRRLSRTRWKPRKTNLNAGWSSTEAEVLFGSNSKPRQKYFWSH